jgi:hypothetical protein
MTKFIASFIRGASPINPDTIEISDGFIWYKKRKIYLIGYEEQILKISRVSSVEINTDIIGTKIIIQSYGGSTITGHRFALTDVKEMKRLINEQI